MSLIDLAEISDLLDRQDPDTGGARPNLMMAETAVVIGAVIQFVARHCLVRAGARRHFGVRGTDAGAPQPDSGRRKQERRRIRANWRARWKPPAEDDTKLNLFAAGDQIRTSARGKARRCASSAASFRNDPSVLERVFLRSAIPDRRFDIRIPKCTMKGVVLSFAGWRTAQRDCRRAVARRPVVHVVCGWPMEDPRSRGTPG